MYLFELSESARLAGVALTATSVAGFVFFTFSRNARLKRRVWPFFNLLDGALLLAIAEGMAMPKSWFYGFIPIVTLIVFLTMRSRRFCDACGRTLRHQGILRPAAVCLRCGAPMAHTLEPGTDPLRIRVPSRGP